MRFLFMLWLSYFLLRTFLFLFVECSLWFDNYEYNTEYSTMWQQIQRDDSTRKDKHILLRNSGELKLRSRIP